jgi:hypothetical protein
LQRKSLGCAQTIHKTPYGIVLTVRESPSVVNPGFSRQPPDFSYS